MASTAPCSSRGIVERSGRPKLLRRCTLPLTGLRCVSAVCTDRAWIEVTADGLALRELAPGETVASVQALTEPRLLAGPDVRAMEVGG